MSLAEIALACFEEYIDEENRNKYETAYVDDVIGVAVTPIFVTTGR